MLDTDISKYWPATVHDRWMSPDNVPGLVSAVIPTYNRSSHIIRALDSVRRQAYRPIEVVVADDGSTDGTKEIVAEWAKINTDDGFSLRYVVQPNRGAPAARNLGLIESSGEFIQFLDSDDFLLPEKLSEHVAVLSRDKSDLVWSPYYVVSEVDGDPIEQRLESSDKEIFSAGGLAEGVPEACCTILFRRPLVRAMGPWDEKLSCRQDWDYIYRCVALAPMCAFTDRPAFVHVHHGGHRIHDKYETEAGVEAVLLVLERARGLLDVSNEVHAFYPRFSQALDFALRHGRRDQILRALTGLRGVVRGPRRVVLSHLLNFSYRLFGKSATAALVRVHNHAVAGAP